MSKPLTREDPKTTLIQTTDPRPRSNIQIPKTLQWSEVTFPENWILENENYPLQIQDPSYIYIYIYIYINIKKNSLSCSLISHTLLSLSNIPNPSRTFFDLSQKSLTLAVAKLGPISAPNPNPSLLSAVTANLDLSLLSLSLVESQSPQTISFDLIEALI